MAASPTALTLEHLRKSGCQLVQVTEKWNVHARVRQDLFGIIDVLAIRDTEVIGVQTTSYSNMHARINKIAESEATPALRKAGVRLLVHGWRKVNGRWNLHEVDVS